MVVESAVSPKIDILAGKLRKLDIEDPSQELAVQFGQNIYFLKTTQRERLLQYFGLWKPTFNERTLNNIIEQVAFAHLNLPIFGVEQDPVHQIVDLQAEPRRRYSRVEDEAGAAVIGMMFPKRNKPFSADSIFSNHWEQNIKDAGETSINVTILADGATMMIDSDLWPNEVRETCLVNSANKPYPDCFWTAGWNALLGNSSIPTPPEFLANSVVQTAYRTKLGEAIKQYVSDNSLKISAENMAKHILLNMINPAIGEFLSNAFPGFRKDNFEYYPSGIGGVIININPYTEQGWKAVKVKKSIPEYMLNGYCMTGDIAITQDGRLINDPYMVDKHDRELDQIFGRDDQAVVASIARKRAAFTGSLQGFSPDPQAVQSGYFMERYKIITAYTDGFRLLPQHLLGKVRREKLKGDATALTLYLDPRLAILERRMQMARPDDASFVLFNPNDYRYMDEMRARYSPFEGMFTPISHQV